MNPNRRKIIIIDPNFQLKFSFIMVSLIFLSGLLYPITFYEALSSFKGMSGAKDQLLKLLLSIQGIFLVLCFIITIFVSHKIAGPIYRTKILLKEMIARKRYFTISFRTSDYFQEFTTIFNEFIETQKKYDQEAILKLLKIETLLGQNNSKEIAPLIQEIKQSLEERIKS